MWVPDGGARYARNRVLAGVLCLLWQGPGRAAPCDGVDRTLSAEQKAGFGRDVAKQLKVGEADVLQSFHLGAWRVLYVDTHVADEAFLFYAADPARHGFVALWSGGAAQTEEPGIRQWVLAHAPGVPAQLAGCFAWHVTKDRDQ